MTGFAADWLDLREAADLAARSRALVTELEPWRRAQAPDAALAVVDLGAGTGANLRFLAPLLGGAQHWTLIDDDPLLLAAQSARLRAWVAALGGESRGAPAAAVRARNSGLDLRASGFCCRIDARELDLATQLDTLELGPDTLVSTSALLDLVGRGWLERLIERICATEAACLFALSFDGRIELAPAHSDDALVRALFNRHQRRDKGFGPALGPEAADTAARLLADRGYRVATARSDWLLGSADAALVEALLAGWHAAAVEAEPASAERLTAWLRARRQALSGAGLDVRVGHIDLAARPPEVRTG